ncbi:MAG: class I SAM-dependent methyltransferase [Methylobacterium sp.]|uniref:class I SAM-dependent methyltransferase n=1 Tax=Methylobacterium sp. TaxID=409 RepID=UPI0025E4C8C7|nr:class I SAM-dependent methyltransferase [Methylobacterium sp.]MBX9931240.1 class I SAM-dependent methyltransferase [Methylobacterium sp.]
MTFFLDPRPWIARRTFRSAYPRILRDPICTEALFEAVAPQPGERVLHVRKADTVSVIALAKLQPEARFVSLEPDERSLGATVREIETLGAANVQPVTASEPRRFPFADASFDKVVSSMNLHTEAPEPRLAMAREMLRVLRRKGLLYAADLDAPTTPQEQGFLKVANFVLGAERIQPHIDGTWPDVLAAAGFSRPKRLASNAFESLRIGVVRAQKR